MFGKDKNFYISRGDACFENEQFAEAVTYYKKALWKDRGCEETSHKLADCHFRLGRQYYDDEKVWLAISHLREAVKYASDSPNALLILGLCYLNKEVNNLSEAINLMESALELGVEEEQEQRVKDLISKTRRELEFQRNCRNEYREFLLRTKIELAIALRTGRLSESGMEELIDQHEAMVEEYASRWHCSLPEAWEKMKINYAGHMEAEMVERMRRSGGFD